MEGILVASVILGREEMLDRKRKSRCGNRKNMIKNGKVILQGVLGAKERTELAKVRRKRISKR